MKLIISLAIFLCTLTLIFWRPRGLSEMWFALAGAVAMMALGFVGWDDVVRLSAETGPVLAFLAGMLVVGFVTDRAGVFAWFALHTARWSRGSGRRLFIGLYFVGVFVTAWFSLDTTAVVLAPIVYNITRTLKIPPLPFVFATIYVANTASLFLPISNLTNLIVWNQLNIPFWEFAGKMAFPALAAITVNLLLFLWLFRRDIPIHFTEESSPSLSTLSLSSSSSSAPSLSASTPSSSSSTPSSSSSTPSPSSSAPSSSSSTPSPSTLPASSSPASLPSPTRSARLSRCLYFLIGILLGLAAAPFFNWEIWIVALIGAAVMAGIEMTSGNLRFRHLASGISWDLLPFVFSLFLILRGVGQSGLSHLMETLLLHTGSGETLQQLVIITGATAIGSNLINNLPMILVAMDSMTAPLVAGKINLGAVYASLLGTNLGPNLTVIGSLATMLSLAILGQRGLRVGGWIYLKIGLITVPFLLLSSVVGLWFALKM